MAKSKRSKSTGRITKLKEPTEHQEQSMFMQWCKREGKTNSVYNLIFAIPNGGWRSKATAARLKLEGVKPGVPDLFLAQPTLEYHGLFIEMKRRRSGSLSPPQKQWKKWLLSNGYAFAMARGAEEAKAIVKKYLESTLLL